MAESFISDNQELESGQFIGGNQRYSGNTNRSFCSEREIGTSFSQKG